MDVKGIFNNVKQIKNADKDQYLLDKSKGTITSTLIGGGLGLMIAYNRKWNLLFGAIIGGAIAGIVGSYFVSKDTNSDSN